MSWFDRELDFTDAVVAEIIHLWTDRCTEPLGRTVVQKLVYFVKAKGVPVAANYDIHYYGPFSQELTERVDWLQIANAIDDQCDNGKRSDYCLTSEGYQFVQAKFSELQSFESIVDEVVNTFANRRPKEMELLATTHFVLQNVSYEQDGISRTIQEVRRIKGSKFSSEEIELAMKELRVAGL